LSPSRPSNASLAQRKFLAAMYADDYFPEHLVKLLEEILVQLAVHIEAADGLELDGLYRLTHAATEQINDVQERFWDAGSEIETAARECIAEEFDAIARAYGFEADLEELIAPRDW